MRPAAASGQPAIRGSKATAALGATAAALATEPYTAEAMAAQLRGCTVHGGLRAAATRCNKAMVQAGAASQPESPPGFPPVATGAGPQPCRRHRHCFTGCPPPGNAARVVMHASMLLRRVVLHNQGCMAGQPCGPQLGLGQRVPALCPHPFVSDHTRLAPVQTKTGAGPATKV